jgi:uncharacterized membrane protein
MSFLAPLMLIGAIAIAVPIAIHLIGRARARVVRFAALDFLLETRRRTARRLRLRERLLLAVRVGVLLAIVLALAKPFTSCKREGPAMRRGPQAAVLVIDDSYATGYVLGGKTLLQAEIEQAQRILVQLGSAAEVAVVRTAEGTDHPGELSRDHLRLRDELAALRPSARPADTTRALTRAAQLLAGSSHATRTVVLLSPLARTGLRPDEAPWGADGPALVVIDPRAGKPLPNLAVVRAQALPDAGAGSRGIKVSAEIANFGPAAVTSVEVALTVAGKVVARGTVDLGPGERRVKTFVAALPPSQRSADVAVKVPGDALALDDVRWLRARLRDEIRVLLVDGDPRTTRHDDELFYLEAALRPGDREDSGTALTTITPDELARTDLGAADVIVLANVAALPAPQVGALAAWVKAGGGLLIAGGDHVEPEAYEKTMLPLLPQSLRDPIDTGWGPATGRDGRALRLVKWDADHPIFAPFGKDAPGLADARFTKLLLLGPTTDTRDRKVLARFTNGAAALVEASLGQGRLLLYTSTIDRDWNDLPIHPGYLPLMQQAIRHLARTQADTGAAEHVVGRSVTLVTGDLKKLEVNGPGGLGAVYEGERLAGRRTVRFTKTDWPGVYTVLGTGPSGGARPRHELAFAVNLDPRGGDLTPASEAELPKPGTGATGAPPPTAYRLELWHAIAAGLLLLLLVEALLAQR